MRKENLEHIQDIFEKKTGVSVSGKKRESTVFPVKKMVFLVVALCVCFALAGFTYPLFSGLREDELSLYGTYEGEGIVSVYVVNESDRDLEFQKQTKLMRWIKSEEVERLEGEVHFENTRFPAHSSGIMRIDLSDAYDIQALEKEGNNPETYYLLLTNNNYLFGHDWMCSVSFREDTASTPEEKQPVENKPADNLNQIEEDLRFYFEKSYEGAPVSLNNANFAYQQKVEEVLRRSGVKIIPALSPDILVGGPSTFLNPEPMLEKIPDGITFDSSISQTQQYLLSVDGWHHTDAYGRMIAGFSEKAWIQDASIPQWEGQTDGGLSLPLVFWLVYDSDAVQEAENHAFVYGRILSFSEMEPYQVWQDSHYAIYDVTDLIYTDLDAYLDYFLSCYEMVYCDAQIRQRVHTIYEYYRSKENFQALYSYREYPVA